MLSAAAAAGVCHRPQAEQHVLWEGTSPCEEGLYVTTGDSWKVRVCAGPAMAMHLIQWYSGLNDGL